MGDKFILEGGHHLSGVIDNQGAKNSALHVIAGSLLATREVYLSNVPDLEDVKNMLALVEEIGADVARNDNSLTITPKKTLSPIVPADTAMKVRSSLLMLGILLNKTGRAVLPLPGGCKIGDRRFDMHLEGLRAMGAEIRQIEGAIEAKGKRLHGAKIDFYYPTVTGTMNITLAAALADGTTMINNAAMNPEVVDFLNFMKALGADIDGTGTGVLKITGIEELGGTDFRIMHDRIAAITYLLAGAVTGGQITVNGVDSSHLGSEIQKLKAAGVKLVCEGESIRLVGTAKLRPLNLETKAYPGFHTDVQPLFASLLCLAEGRSTIKETILDNRFGYVPELEKMGANIRVERGDFLCVNGRPGGVVVIEGGNRLRGADLWATDLRAGAALVIAALAADGRTCIQNVEQIDRGYSSLEIGLAGVGADIKRVISDS